MNEQDLTEKWVDEVRGIMFQVKGTAHTDIKGRLAKYTDAYVFTLRRTDFQ